MPSRQREGRGIALLIHNLGTRRERWSAPHSGRFIPRKQTQQPFYKRLFGLRGWSEMVWRVSPTPGLEPWTVQPVVSRYTDYIISVASGSVPHNFSLNYRSSVSNFLPLELKLNAVIFGPQKCNIVQQKHFFITKLSEQLVRMQLWCGTFITQYSCCPKIQP